MNTYLVYLISYFIVLNVRLNATQDTSVITYTCKRAQYTQAQAAYTLGYARYQNSENQQERQLGLQLITNAAQWGHVEAQVFLGDYYYITIGNIDRAETWYKRAADAYNAQACYGYACIARNKRNFGVAATYFRKAALLGYRYALSELGVLYLKGKGIGAQNYQKAYELFRQGALCGDDIARANILLFEKVEHQADAFEKLLVTSKYPVVKEYCLQALDKLARTGNIEACLYQAYNYAHTRSIQEQDSAKAHEYLRMTEYILRRPQPFSQRLIKRTKLYQTLMRLVELKSSYACWFLSQLWLHKDPVRATMYKKQAFEYGSLPDGLELALCYHYTTCSAQEKEEALGYYRQVLVKAYEQNNRAILDAHTAELEQLSTTYIEAQAQLLLLALWGAHPQMASLREIRAYFGALHKKAYILGRHSLSQRLLQEVEELAAQEMHGRCACFLASIYLTPGIYYTPDKGMQYLEQALKHTTEDALGIFIECIDNHVYGISPKTILYSSTIITYIHALSTYNDDWRAHYIRGVWSLLGYPIKRDNEQALALFARVHEQMPGHRGAYYWMGLTQLYKIQEQTDIQLIQEYRDQAISLLSKAAEKKFEPALFTLGKIYQEGIMYNQQFIVAQDTARAFEYFKQLTALGHSGGTYQLGLMYYYGNGIEKNNKKAFELLQKAYKAGIENALEGLGLIFCAQEGTGQKLTYKQQITILNILETIATQPEHKKYIQACMYLIKIYREGIGIKKDIKKATDYALALLRQITVTQQILKMPECRKEIGLLLDVLAGLVRNGDVHLCGALAELYELYFKPDFEQFAKDTQDINAHIRLKGLLGLVASYVHGRGVAVDLSRAVSYALEILRTPAYTDLLQPMLEVNQQAKSEKNADDQVCFARLFLVAMHQLISTLKKMSVVDKKVLTLYNIVQQVVNECPLHQELKFKCQKFE